MHTQTMTITKRLKFKKRKKPTKISLLYRIYRDFRKNGIMSDYSRGFIVFSTLFMLPCARIFGIISLQTWITIIVIIAALDVSNDISKNVI